jgi:glutaredoxin
VDVKQTAAHLDAMLKLSGGKRQVPVIVKGKEVTIGFGGS